MHYIQLHNSDNVVVATTDLETDTALGLNNIVVKDAVPRSHKIASQHIAAGAGIIKYGQTIAYASREINAGEHVHTHNVEMAAFYHRLDPTDRFNPGIGQSPAED